VKGGFLIIYFILQQNTACSASPLLLLSSPQMSKLGGGYQIFCTDAKWWSIYHILWHGKFDKAVIWKENL